MNSRGSVSPRVEMYFTGPHRSSRDQVRAILEDKDAYVAIVARRRWTASSGTLWRLVSIEENERSSQGLVGDPVGVRPLLHCIRRAAFSSSRRLSRSDGMDVRIGRHQACCSRCRRDSWRVGSDSSWAHRYPSRVDRVCRPWSCGSNGWRDDLACTSSEPISITTNVFNAAVMGYVAYGRWKLAPLAARNEEPPTS